MIWHDFKVAPPSKEVRILLVVSASTENISGITNIGYGVVHPARWSYREIFQSRTDNVSTYRLEWDFLNLENQNRIFGITHWAELPEFPVSK